MRYRTDVGFPAAPDGLSGDTAFGVFAAAILVCGAIVGCGTPAAPEPPSLNLPTPVLNLSAARIGNSVHLAWTMPTRTTDKVALHEAVRVQICRAVQDAACSDLATILLAPGAKGEYSDDLPFTLTEGSDQLLRYEITLRNHAGKSAGPSNSAYSAAGASPPALTGLTWQMRRDGVQLNWQASSNPGRSIDVRIQRLQLSTSPTEQGRKSQFSPSASPVMQTLVVHTSDGVDPGHAIDSSAQFNQEYRYILDRVETPAGVGRPVEVQGIPSSPIVVATTDVFPPAVPQGLAAVAVSDAGAIDLSWSPGTENDLASYSIFRRDTHETFPAQRIASVKLETSFRDSGVKTGHTYAYSVSAIDQNGNESQRSSEVEETLSSR